ncbi:hypothetical protein BH09VER1_BH09VER1_12090 [soil metagenome]
MKTHIRKILLLAAVTLPLAFQLHAQPSSQLVGPRPPKAGDEKIVKSSSQGYLRVFTPEDHVYDPILEDFVWENGNYGVRPQTSAKARTWFHGRSLALTPGVYIVEIRDDNYKADIRAAIKPGRITTVWLNDSDRPKFTATSHSALVHGIYGNPIGYRAR